MTLLARPGEILEQSVQVSSPIGSGILYVTSMGLILEIPGKGIYMDLQHGIIRSVLHTGRDKIVVSWIENEKNGFSFEFRTDKAEEFARDITEKHNHSANFSDSHEGQIMQITKEEKESIRNQRLQNINDAIFKLQCQLTEISLQMENVPDDKQKQQRIQDLAEPRYEIQRQLKLLEQNKESVIKMPITRSSIIPKEIDSVNVWNDAYYDESRKAYVTFNKRFHQMKNAKYIQIQFDKERREKLGVVIEESKTTTKYGIPAIIAEDQDGNPVWHLLPTMTDEMLSDEIVTNRLQAKTHNDSVLYDTVSEAWLSMGTKGLMLTEREREVGVKIGRYVDFPTEQLKLINHRK